MKKLEVNQMENLEGGKFWGWTDWEPMGPCTNGWVAVVRHYDTLWVNTGLYDYDFRRC
jgi:hypothetical protein